ncbi:MAG: DUF559 domain-containing protein [Nitriliruptoraceae bacterium]
MRAIDASVSLDALAARTSGIVTRPALLASGWSESRVDRAVSSRALLPVAAGVYRVRGAPWTRQASRQAAVAIAGAGATLARWSAAEMLGIADPRPGPHHVLVPHARRSSTSAPGLALVTRTRHLEPSDVTEIAGIAVTTAARTLLDLAREIDAPRLAELSSEAIRRTGLGLGDLSRILERHRKTPGRRRLRDAIGLLGDDGHRFRSMVEVRALSSLLEAGLPRPEVGYTIRSETGVILAEVDLAYPTHRLAIEIDGFRWHSSPARKRADEDRQNRLLLAGWTVLRFSATVVHDSPATLVEAVAEALGHV